MTESNDTNGNTEVNATDIEKKIIKQVEVGLAVTVLKNGYLVLYFRCKQLTSHAIYII